MAGLIPSTIDDATRVARAAPGGPAGPDDTPEPGVGTRIGAFVANVGSSGMQGVAEGVRSTVFGAGGALAVARDAPSGSDVNAFFASGGKTKPPFSTEHQDEFFGGDVLASLNDAVSYWTPDARTTGTATRIVGGFAKLAGEAMVGGAPGVLAGEQIGTALDLSDKGVDATTANTVGTIAGAANVFGLTFAGFGGNLASRIATNFAANVGVAYGTGKLEQTALESAGYEKLAQQVDLFDPHARTLDLLTGLVMAASHRGVPRGTLAEQDAALAAANANRVQTSSAPATPATAAGEAAHVSALDAAIAAAVRGEPVDVTAAINPADFHVDQPNPRAATVAREARTSAVLGNLTGPRAAVRDAAVTAGADPSTTLAIAQIESRMNPNALTPIDPATGKRISTAAGLGQFLDSTWQAMGGTDANRFDVATQARLLAELTVRNTDDLRAALGRQPEPAEVYLAHLLGVAGAKKMLNANPSALVADVAGKRIAANNGMEGMTVAQAVDHWREKLSTAGAEPVQPNSALSTPRPTPVSTIEPTTVNTSATSGESVNREPGNNGTRSIPTDDTLAAGEVKTGPQADLETARQTVEANPDLIVPTEEGGVISARDALAQTDLESQDAEHFSQLYQIAINCALRGGH